MNKLTIEQKAKAYDEALARANEMIKAMTNIGGVAKVDDMQHIFPELKEFKDERIRKALVEMVHDTTGDSLWIDYNVHKEDALAWLEKQGAHKPQGKSALEVIKEERVDNANKVEPKDYSSIDPHFFKPAWSEEDDVAVKDICDKLNRLSMTYVGNESIVCQEEIKWLKSLRHQFTWKPSDEQMDALETAVSSLQSTALESLYNELKKL